MGLRCYRPVHTTLRKLDVFRFLKGKHGSGPGRSGHSLDRCRRLYANVFVSAPSGYALVSKATGRWSLPSGERAWASSSDGGGANNKRNGPLLDPPVAVHVGEVGNQ
jgi:hypothetical protein